MHAQSFLWAEGARRRPDRRSRRLATPPFFPVLPSFPLKFFLSFIQLYSAQEQLLGTIPAPCSVDPPTRSVASFELSQPSSLKPPSDRSRDKSLPRPALSCGTAPALPPSVLPSLLRPTQSAHHDAVARFPQPQLDGSCPRMSEPVSFANPNPRSPLRPPSQPTHLRIHSTDSSDGSSSSPPTLDFFNLTERRGSLRSLHHDPNRNSGGSWNGDLPQSRRGSAVGHALNPKRSGELGWSPNKYVPLLSCQTWRLLCLGADQHPPISARTVLTGPAPQRLQDVHPSPRPSPSTTHRSFL